MTYLELIKHHQHNANLFKALLIGDILKSYLDNNPLYPTLDFDINPHITIQGICDIIVNEASLLGVEATREYVMLHWLTNEVYNLNVKTDERISSPTL